MVLSSQQVKSELDFRVSTLPTHLGTGDIYVAYYNHKTPLLGRFDVSHLKRTWFIDILPESRLFFDEVQNPSLTEACLSLSKENIRVMGIPANFSLMSEIGYSKTPCILIMVNHHFPQR